MKFGPLLIALLFFAPPAAVLAQSGTGVSKGVVEDWSEVRAAGTRATLQAFIRRWPEEPLYIALAERILEDMPIDPPIAEIAPTALRAPLPLASPQLFVQLRPSLPAPDLPARRAVLPLSFPLSAIPAPPRVDLSPPLAGTQADAALEFLQFTIDLQLDAKTNLEDAINSYYTERILFYNNDWTRTQVISDKRGFFARWPERSYEFIPGKTVVACENDLCRIEAEMLFEARSPARQAVSAGRAQFSYIVNMRDIPLIQLESSTVLERF